MPVKKNKNEKKKTPRKKKTTEEYKEVPSAKEIKQAVKEIPSLILEELYQHHQKDTQTQTQNMYQKTLSHPNLTKPKSMHQEPAPIQHPPRQKKVWLWTGVILFTMVIMGMWVFNISNLFYNITTTEGEEEKLIETNKKQFSEIFSALKQDDMSLEQAINGVTTTPSSTPDNPLTDILANALAPLFVQATTSATTTPIVSVTSTNKITSSTPATTTTTKIPGSFPTSEDKVTSTIKKK